MTLIGLLVTLLGFAIAVASLGVMDGTGGRMVMVIAGILISLFGILGLINREAMKHAIWRK